MLQRWRFHIDVFNSETWILHTDLQAGRAEFNAGIFELLPLTSHHLFLVIALKF